MTATATPQPDPKAMIDWQALGLPASFSAISPSELGIDKTDEATWVEDGGQKKVFLIENSFVFTNDDKTQLYMDTLIFFHTSIINFFYQQNEGQVDLGYPITKPSD
jgi:hypothetical protein